MKEQERPTSEGAISLSTSSASDHSSVTSCGLPARPSEFWETYSQSSRTVRDWFLAFGIGAPAIFVTSEYATRALVQSGTARRVVMLYLAGVGLQVAIGVIYKHSMSYLYLHEGNEKAKDYLLDKVICSITDQTFFDFLIDVATLGFFSYATYLVVNALIPPWS